MITCKNCNNTFEGNYCNICRQSADTQRISWHEVLHHLPHALFHADKGLFYSIKELTVRPGITIRDYLNGKRINHFNPFLYLILIGGFASFLYVALHENPLNREIELGKLNAYNSTIAYKYFALVGGLFILLLSVTDYILYFRKKYVLPEIIVSNTFQIGQVMFFVIAAIPFLLLQNFIVQKTGTNIELRMVLRVILLGYLFFVRFQFYEANRNYGLIIKIAIQLILVYLLYHYLITNIISAVLKQER